VALIISCNASGGSSPGHTTAGASAAACDDTVACTIFMSGVVAVNTFIYIAAIAVRDHI
jgi:hypothetical protein